MIFLNPMRNREEHQESQAPLEFRRRYLAILLYVRSDQIRLQVSDPDRAVIQSCIRKWSFMERRTVAPSGDEWKVLASLGLSGWAQHKARHRVNVMDLCDFRRSRSRRAKFNMPSAVIGCAPQPAAQHICQGNVLHGNDYLPTHPSDGSKDLREIQHPVIIDMLYRIVHQERAPFASWA